MKKNSIYLTLSLITMMLWGSLYPCIKLGYKAFDIDTTNVSQILMFAGVRFILCGIIITVFAVLRKEKLARKSIGYIALAGFFTIILHYTCTYIGLALTNSSKTAILKQLGTLFYICFAFLFVKEEKFSINKIIGAIVGFCGIVAINSGPGGGELSLGDALIILASVCTVAGSLASKKALKNTTPIMFTGISQLFGGTFLLITAFSMGGEMVNFNSKSVPILAYICAASIVAYCLWNYVISKTELSKNFIIKFAEPLFACIFGAILLGEDIFKWQYLVSFVLISLGIVIGNLSNKKIKVIRENV